MTTSEVSAAWIRERLRLERPRLVWRPGDAALLREKAEADESIRALLQFVLRQAEGIVDLPVPERRMEGRRLLDVSRLVLKRASFLACAWRITRDGRFVDALDTLLRTVCSFDDWNPLHFLDTAEMAVAVAVGIDWAHDALHPTTCELASAALIGHAVQPSFIPELAAQLPLQSNWNPVCNAGVLAAALAVDSPDSEMLSRVIGRMLEWLPHALEMYEPDGLYPEGPSYWSYGTRFHALIVSMLETALGETFKLDRGAGYSKTAESMQRLIAPSGEWYNFSDCGPRPILDEAFLWFAARTGNRSFLQEPSLHKLGRDHVDPAGADFRLAAVALAWLASFQEKTAGALPSAFHGRGPNPVVVLRSTSGSQSLFLACKGGSPALSHAHMDAGSFVLEQGGVRWAIDLGNQEYHQIETAMAREGLDLWDFSQSSGRWKLLSKNNFGHSTLTVDRSLHRIEGAGAFIDFDADNASATLNLQPALGPKVHKAKRTFRIINDGCVEIEDRLVAAETINEVRWQMLTLARVHPFQTGALLEQSGRKLHLELAESTPPARLSVTPLHPPPARWDLHLPALKRVDITLDGPLPAKREVIIRVRLAGRET